MGGLCHKIEVSNRTGETAQGSNTYIGNRVLWYGFVQRDTQTAQPNKPPIYN